MQDFPSDFQRAMAEFEILVDLGKDSHNVTDMDLDTEELIDDNENGNENSKLRMPDEIGGTEEFTEKNAENGLVWNLQMVVEVCRVTVWVQRWWKLATVKNFVLKVTSCAGGTNERG